MKNEREFYVTYDENSLITGCGYCEEHEVQNKSTVCWNCKMWFTKLNIDEHYGYYCPYCNQSLRNHPVYGEHPYGYH